MKQLLQTHILSASHAYEWYEMAFITYFVPDVARIILCLDVPPALQPQMLSALSLQFQQGHEFDAYSAHIPLIYEMITLYDNSVWGLRDTIRTIEKVSNRLVQQYR